MDLTTYVSSLGREFATLADMGGEEARALVDRLTGSLESAIRMTLLDALSAAADEITRDLAPGSVELRLRAGEPNFVVTMPPVDPMPTGDVSTAIHDLSDNDVVLPEDGPAARINVRLPEQLKAMIEEAAAREGRSANAWLVRAAALALRRTDRDPGTELGGGRTKQRFTGWVR